MGLKKLLKGFGRKKKKTATATAKVKKNTPSSTVAPGTVHYVPASKAPASRYMFGASPYMMSSASLYRPVSSSGGSMRGYSGGLSPGLSGLSGLSGGFSGGFSSVPYTQPVVVSSSGSGRSGRSSRNSSQNTYVHVPGKYQTVVPGKPAHVDPGAMIAKVGDIIAYSHVDDGVTYHWLGKVKSLTPDGVVVEQRGDFSNTQNVVGKSVTLDRNTRNVRIFKFKRISPKNVKAYERQGFRFSHTAGGNGGNGGESADRSLLRNLGRQQGQYISFVYKGRPVFGQIEKIDMRTGEVHMKTSPTAMYNQNLLGIPIPTPGATAEIKFRPTANSQVSRLRGTPSKAYKDSLRQRGFQNLSAGFEVSNKSNANAMGMNYLVKSLLGKHAKTFEGWATELRIIKGLQDDKARKDELQKFIVTNLADLEQLEDFLRDTKQAAAVKNAVRDMKDKLMKKIQKDFFESQAEFDAMMSKSREVVEEQKRRGFVSTLLRGLSAGAGYAGRALSYGTSFIWTPPAASS